ncbi:MAG: hypothetical protein M3065_05575, partial [Actinomycetota bacterium]|nr:hypothetical protein [Actinomycetota bacterium]
MSVFAQRLFRRTPNDTSDRWFEQSLWNEPPKVMRGAGFFNWLRSGRTDAQRVGSRGLGIETMETFGETAAHTGARHGRVRNPDKLVTGDDASMHRFVKGGSKVRKREVSAGAHRGTKSAAERAATSPARKEAQLALKKTVYARLVRTMHRRDKEATKIVSARERVQAEEQAYAQLPRSEQGYFEFRRTVLLIEGFVVAFDLPILRDALTHSGMRSTTMWLASIGLPLVIFAANRALGVTGGVIGRATAPEKRLRLAVSAFAAGLTFLMGGFIALMVFRAAATSAINQTIQNLVNGHHTGNLSLLVPLHWMAFLQVAGSIAAISAVALWTMGSTGRRRQERINQAKKELCDHEATFERLEAEIEELHRQSEATEVAIYEIEADKA